MTPNYVLLANKLNDFMKLVKKDYINCIRVQEQI